MTVTTVDKLAAVTLAEEQFRDTAPTAAAALEALRRDMEREQHEQHSARVRYVTVCSVCGVTLNSYGEMCTHLCPGSVLCIEVQNSEKSL